MVWVRLNIGGTSYQTTSETLLSRGECFFTGLLSNEIPSEKDSSGAFLIDRNGRLFEPILEFLRTGVLDIEGFSSDAVSRELDFYQIRLDKTDNGGDDAQEEPSFVQYEFFLIYVDKEFMWKGNPEGYYVSFPSHLHEIFRTYCKDGFVPYSDVANLITVLSKIGFQQDTCSQKLWTFRRLIDPKNPRQYQDVAEEDVWDDMRRLSVHTGLPLYDSSDESGHRMLQLRVSDDSPVHRRSPNVEERSRDHDDRRYQQFSRSVKTSPRSRIGSFREHRETE